jgi:tetratricopeptide (TPR) repeat protein
LREDANQSLATVVAGYRRVLNLAPGHQAAEAALASIADQWKADIRSALEQGNLTLAENKLDETTQAFPNDASLVDLSRQLTNRKHAERLLASTQGLLSSHGLSDIPSATAAIQAYQEVRRLAPGHVVAQAELDALGQHYANLAAQAADEGQVEQAIGFLDRASAANDQLPELALVREKIQEAATLQSAISDMLQQASAYRGAGALINPPGQNAAELYHRVLATAPDNAIAAQGLNEVVSQLLARRRVCSTAVIWTVSRGSSIAPGPWGWTRSPSIGCAAVSTVSWRAAARFRTISTKPRPCSTTASSPSRRAAMPSRCCAT